MELTVLVVDQNPEVCALVARMLDRLSSVRVIAHSTNVMLAAELAHQLAPDAILADFTRDRTERTTKLGWLHRMSPTSALIVYATYYTEGERDAFEAAGADLCLLKGMPVAELVAQINNAVCLRGQSTACVDSAGPDRDAKGRGITGMHEPSDDSVRHQEGRWNMNGFVGDIEDLTATNTNFRRVLYTGKHLQLVLMALQPGEEIGEEVHTDRDQFFRVEKGKGQVMIDGNKTPIKEGDAMLVPGGARHNVTNTGDTPLLLYTLYGPPEHKDGIVHKTKAEAEAAEEHFDGKTTD